MIKLDKLKAHNLQEHELYLHLKSVEDGLAKNESIDEDELEEKCEVFFQTVTY